ncbi:class I SAM-dependent methyltransferase [Kitasatospora sp. NPDC002227]|uniref:class I SAM-dependent methyltransferase n=1 Tax=Kitasatospora sp. NPDC002227 TaxID=3154773 RepID=UPI003325D1F7
MLNYDDEAVGYDAGRGGEARAAAAAAAVRELVPEGAVWLADLACGTGIVTARLAAPGREVVGVDISAGMLRFAAGRLPGRVLQGDATRLPLGENTLDAVVMVWLLHLMDEATALAAFGEAARVVRPGGVLVTTVDKADAAYLEPSDVAGLIAPVRARCSRPNADGLARLTARAAELGLRPTGQAGFTGLGQGRSPQEWRSSLLAGRFDWTASPAGAAELPGLCERLAALPGQDVPRPDPVYRVVSFTKEG